MSAAEISSMSYSRAYFTPCCTVYLASADRSQQVETFNAETDTFAVLSVFLLFNFGITQSVVFIANGELCVLTTEKQS